MKVLCNLITKKIEAFSRWDDLPFDSATQVLLTVVEVPDMENDSLNATNDGIINSPPSKTKKEIVKSLANVLQNVLDSEAQKLGYDNINIAVSYAGEAAVATFQTDGISFRAWRSKVWEYYSEVISIKDAQLIPEDIMANMPVRV